MSNVAKSHTFVDLADKPSKLRFVSVPIESASRLQLTHAGPQFGPVSHYRIRIPDLKRIQGVWVENGGHLK